MTAAGHPADAVIVGAGAAGLATAIFAARGASGARIVCLDGAARPGAKILVSGGSRCNVTNREVAERDFWGGQSRTIRNVLRAFPAERAAGFFEDLGVGLHEEEDGKLFPNTNRARTVLDALLAEAQRLGVDLRTGARVVAVRAHSSGPAPAFTVALAGGGELQTRLLVLATGGQSLPKSGSDGAGYGLAKALGHGLVTTTPALAPLALSGDRHLALAGRSHPATLTLVGGGPPTVLTGALLWTHFGISGPVALNMSRHWHRVRLTGAVADVRLSLLPGETHASLDAWFLEQARERPKARVSTILSTRLPSAVADRWAAESGVADETLAQLPRDLRRALGDRLLNAPLGVRDSRGYAYAEVTAGGVPLDEVDARTMESRVCPGLHLVGEILDVDGRLGGFNFQWAWSSAWVAGRALAHATARTRAVAGELA